MTYISTNKESFGVVAKEYAQFRGSYNTDLYKAIFSIVKDTTDLHILDLGCGVGNSTEPLLKIAKTLKKKVSVTECDIDERMLTEGRLSAKKNKLPITYIQSPAEKMPFKKGEFDFIITGAAFHWFANKKAMKEIQRVLKKDGFYAIFWTQSIQTKRDSVGTEIYKKYKFRGIPAEFRDPICIKKILRESGFTKIKTLKVPYVQKKTIAENIGLIKTNSGYAVLSPEDKKSFVKEMTKEYKRVYGTKKSTLNQEINICYGFN